MRLRAHVIVAMAFVLVGCGPDAIDQRAADELIDRFPDVIGGDPFPVRAVFGDDLDEVGGLAFAEPFGVSADDILFATGGTPRIGEDFTTVTAVRVLGVSADRLLQRMIDLTWPTVADPTTPLAVGAKQLRTAGAGTYVYASGDTVYLISGDPEPGLELLEALP